MTIAAGDRAIVATGVALELPPGTEAQIRPRSGLAARGIVAAFGTIDSDYRGEIKVILENRSADDFVVNDGDRVAQIVFAPVLHVDLREVAELSETGRGRAGFGSTGRLPPKSTAPCAVLVCGSRSWADSHAVTQRLLAYPSGPETVLLHGDCRGADRIAAFVGGVRGWTIEAFPADWDAHGRSAGPRRNQRMVDALDEYRRKGFKTSVEAFPAGGVGTRDAVKRARGAGFRVHEYAANS
jgi:dUTP pyrophosphatase